MKNYLLKACKKCGGDLARDWGDWICLQCGAYCYVGLYAPETRPGQRPAAAANPPQQPALPDAGFPSPGGPFPAGTERAAAAIRVSRPGGETRPAGTERAAAIVGVTWPDSPACWAVTR